MNTYHARTHHIPVARKIFSQAVNRFMKVRAYCTIMTIAQMASVGFKPKPFKRICAIG